MGGVCQGNCYQEDSTGNAVLDESGSLGITVDAFQIGVMVMHGDPISMAQQRTTMCYCSLLKSRFPIKGLSVSVVVCVLASSLYYPIMLSRVEAVTIYSCVGSERVHNVGVPYNLS
jgi:hypothetical protein